ncbi:helix-turn-helix domain-containing protein [Rhizobium leguminosarum]|uniref:helix-turn-helix domain-containing protein n=1 Tax=Rhizobium leguminosarum TaxID=384 RepID=UPI001C96BDCA|nr:helix-turn-helix domain-containing protein [Rhizobium leguminosarum]MBY5356060.1 helix-turn-helix domain-containing protein [Rhizobium leguminosarum]
MDRIGKSLVLFSVAGMNDIVPSFFVYGEPDRPLEIGFLHVETVMARANLHSGQVQAHKHDRMAQVTFWTSGSGSYFVEDQRLDFLAPAVSFVPSGVIHGFNVDPLVSDAVVVSIADSLLPSIAGQTTLPLDRPVMVSGQGAEAFWERLRRTVQLILEEYAEGRGQADTILSPLVAAMLSQIGRLASEAPMLAQSPQRLLAGELRRLIDRHFRENWPVARYVSSLGTTPHLLAKAGHMAFGQGVKDMIAARRLLEAKRLLLFTIRSLEDIAYEVGLKDAAYFSRFFRARTGMPPSEWRRQNIVGEKSRDGEF